MTLSSLIEDAQFRLDPKMMQKYIIFSNVVTISKKSCNCAGFLCNKPLFSS